MEEVVEKTKKLIREVSSGNEKKEKVDGRNAGDLKKEVCEVEEKEKKTELKGEN